MQVTLKLQILNLLITYEQLVTANKRGAGSAPKAQQIRLPMTSPQSQRELNRLKKFKTLIDAEDIDLGIFENVIIRLYA